MQTTAWILFGLACFFGFGNWINGLVAAIRTRRDPNAGGYSFVPLFVGLLVVGTWYFDDGTIGWWLLLPLVGEPLVVLAPWPPLLHARSTDADE